MTRRILILGGTKEALELANKLVGQGNHVITSLAGRTREPKPVEGITRTGGFGGAEGLAIFLETEKIDLLIDATHPFATQISANAIKAAKLTGIEFQSKQRPPWIKINGDQWIEVDDLIAARNAIPTGARVLLALGSQYIDIFKSRTDVHFLVRMVDKPDKPLQLPDHELLIGLPGTNPEQEKQLLKDEKITHIVCRNSGGMGAYAKIEAARNLSLPVIMITRNSSS